jgi:hypothetical protein
MTWKTLALIFLKAKKTYVEHLYEIQQIDLVVFSIFFSEPLTNVL